MKPRVLILHADGTTRDLEAAQAFKTDVDSGNYPGPDHSYDDTSAL